MTIYSDTFTNMAEIRDALDGVNGRYSGTLADKNAIVDTFEALGYQDLIPQTEYAAKLLLDALDSTASNYASLLVSRLIHRTVLENTSRIGSVTDRQQLLEKSLMVLWTDLVGLGETVTSNTVTVGAVSATKTNTNAGTLYTTTKLSGVDAPTPGAPVNYQYFDVTTELSKADTCVVECTIDTNGSQTYGRGYEQFRVSGKPSQPAPFSARYSTDGDGNSLLLIPVQGRSVIDLDFTSFTSNLPDGWTHVAGTAGADYLQETTIIVEGHGASSLEITGTGEIKYSLSRDMLVGRSQMCLVFLRRTDAASAGTFTISVEGTGFTTVTTGAVNASSLSTTTFEPVNLRIPVPASIPSDLRIRIVWSGITGGSVYIDAGGLAPYQYWNGVGLALTEGHDRFTTHDRFTFTTSNTFAGDNQTTLAKVCRAQLPSAGVGTYP